MFERIQHLSSAMAAGNAAAVDAFYRQYFDWMYSQARRVTRRDESFCLDVVQDAVLRIIRTVKPVDSEPRFRGWLRLVVQTTAYDLLRSEARRRNREAMAGKSQLDVESDSLQLDWLREQIGQLDPDLVNLIELRFEQSWSLRQIGEKLGLSISAVDGRLRRAMKNLKLAEEDAPDPPTPLPPPESPRSGRPEGALIAEPAVDSPRSDHPDGDPIPQPPPESPLRSGFITQTPDLRYSEEPDRTSKDPALRSTSEPASSRIVEVMKSSLSGHSEGTLQPPATEPAHEFPVTATPDTLPPPVEPDTFELVGLEDEAGAYDDTI